MHFGVCSVLPHHLQQGTSAEAGRSVNEAVNFVPVQWLGGGLVRHAEWMQWLLRSWVPMQHIDSMQHDGLQYMRAAVVDETTNYLVALHCSCHWSYVFFERLQALLVGPAAATPTQRAVDQWLNGNEQLLADAIRCVHIVLTSHGGRAACGAAGVWGRGQ